MMTLPYLGVGFFAWGAIHSFSTIAVVLYFAIWFVGPPIVAFRVGLSTYRKVSSRSSGHR